MLIKCFFFSFLFCFPLLGFSQLTKISDNYYNADFKLGINYAAEASYILHINQFTDDISGGIRLRNSNNQGTFFWMDANNRFFINNAANGNRDILFNYNGNGGVGIGVTNAREDLHVNNNMLTASSKGYQTIRDQNLASARGLFVGDAGYVLDNNNGALNVVSRTSLKFYVDEASSTAKKVMEISKSGNIGINNSPNGAYDLFVGNNLRVGRIIQRTLDDDDHQFDIAYNKKLHFTHGNNLDMKIMTIEGLWGSGKVGIGTENPDERLTVNGNIHATGNVRTTEVIVNTDAGTVPDYVFEPDYKLRSLSDVEQYIKMNKHLPEIPSAKEVEAEGLELSKMNLLLLKKIEELTLHMIEMEKQNNLQEEEIEKLKKLLNK